MQNKAYNLKTPTRITAPFVFSSPHSGCVYSPSFVEQSRLPLIALRSSEDAFVDALYDFSVELGAPLLSAMPPRSYIDLNRGQEELDPALIEGIAKQRFNPRVANGLGVIPRIVGQQQPIYNGKLSLSEVQGRIAQYWQPYHEKLTELLEASHKEFGQTVLIDCHSMPSRALDYFAGSNAKQPDVILGDLFGASCDQNVMAALEACLTQAGLRVERNIPFSGAYILRHYGRPFRGVHAVQVEINRALYMDEARIEKNGQFEALKQQLICAFEQFMQVDLKLICS